MKQLPIRMALCFFTFFLCVTSTQGQQQFKWVTGGGTNEDLSADPLADERTEYMCTDANENVYALSQVGTYPIYADTFIRLSGAYGDEQNVLLTSYNCSGQMRWAKLIASPYPCSPYGIIADNTGHIYVAGMFTNSTLYIGYDTTIDGFAQVDGLIQFDTSGHFNWMQYIGDNTLVSTTGSGPIVLTIDGSNNLHLLTYLEDGVHITPTITSVYGTYDLVYNASATLLSSVRLDLDSEWLLNSATIDPATNKLYVCGATSPGFYVGGLTDTTFAAAFDTSRNLLWRYNISSDTQGSGVTDIVIDESKYLHFSGFANTYIVGIPSTFSFNGMSVSNTDYPNYKMAVILTTDTNGHPEWIKKFDGDLNINGFNSINLLPNKSIAAVGTFAGHITDGVSSLTTLSGYGYSPYFAIIDSAGNLQNLQQAYGDGFYNDGLVITSDNVGNIYIGGDVSDSIFGGTIPAYHTVGGNSDFFVMKYGVDCSCISGPAAAYTDTGTHHTIGVTYTGTTTGLDSVVWSFGDGTTATGTTAVHTYTATGTYNVCVTTYTDCGIDEKCGSFVVDSVFHVLVGSVTSANIRVYPNPARDELNVTGLVGSTDYRLLNVTGVSVQEGALQQGSGNISMQDIVAGVYVLELTGMDGRRDIVRVVKE